MNIYKYYNNKLCKYLFIINNLDILDILYIVDCDFLFKLFILYKKWKKFWTKNNKIQNIQRYYSILKVKLL